MATRMVDTDVYSFLTTSKNGSLRALYTPHLQSYGVALSFITVGEQYAGILKKIKKGEWPESRIQQLEDRLKLLVIVPYDHQVCRIYANLKTSLRTPTGTDRVIPTNDLWIAACAMSHSLTLVTHNRKHFSNIPGLDIICEAPPERW
jgi:predicted nucleic acid-binding protein